MAAKTRKGKKDSYGRMPTCTPSRTTLLRKGGSIKGQTELYAALEFLFALTEQVDKKPSPSVEEFMASAKAIFKGHAQHRKTLKGTHRKTSTRRIQGGAVPRRIERFLERMLETQGSLDTPCNAFFAHLNVVLLAVTIYTYTAAVIEVYPSMSPPPESLSAVLGVAAAAAGRPVFVNSFADPVRWFVVQTVPHIQSQIDQVYVVLQQMFQFLIETMSSAHITSESYTAFAIGSAILFYLRQRMVAPFVFRHAVHRPLACVLEALGVVSCHEHCMLSRRSLNPEAKSKKSRRSDRDLENDPDVMSS